MNPFLYQKFQRAETDVRFVKSQLPQCRTLQDVARTVDVHIDPLVRPLKHLVSGYRQLPSWGERRAEEILLEQLEQVRRASDEEADRLISRFRRTEWAVLRGRWPRLYLQVERMLQTRRQPGRS